MKLFDELIAAFYATENKCEILSIERSKKVFENFVAEYPLTWGRIDWAKVNNKISIQTVEDVVPNIEKIGKDVSEPIYILWGDASLPVVRCMIADAMKNIEIIKFLGGTASEFYSIEQGFVIEFYHDGEIMLGFTKK